jgi:hypothetical protein
MTQYQMFQKLNLGHGMILAMCHDGALTNDAIKTALHLGIEMPMRKVQELIKWNFIRAGVASATWGLTEETQVRLTLTELGNQALKRWKRNKAVNEILTLSALSGISQISMSQIVSIADELTPLLRG